MGDQLWVDPVEVAMAADHVDVAAEGLRSAHGSAHERMGAAQTGWIGASAAALAAATAKWEDESAGHYNGLVDRVEALRSAASQYAGTDTQGGAAIDAAAMNLDSMR